MDTERWKHVTKTPEDILRLFSKGRSIVIVDEQQQPISHAAATRFYPDGSIEIGSVYTAAKHRGKGAATNAVLGIVAMMAEQHPDRRIFALGVDSLRKSLKIWVGRKWK
jgi:predicted GNAT family acetyltransferase